MRFKSLSVQFFGFVLSLTATLGATQIAHAKQGQIEIKTLQEARKELKPKAYSPEERELVARQALFFIKNFYVHRELKIKDFGAGSDAVPRLEDIVRKARILSDEQFHLSIQKIFLDLHDHHTNYFAPMPLRCSYVLAPLSFTDAYDGGSLKVLVSGRTKALQSDAPEAGKANIGDELVAVNGKPIAGILNELRQWSGGANEDAMVVGALMKLSLISLDQLPTPKADTIKYTLKRGNETFTIDTKYFAIVNLPACAESFESEQEKKASKTSLFERSDENPEVRLYRELVKNDVTPFAQGEQELPVGRFYAFKTPAGTIAKFDLETFVPERNVSGDAVIHEVKGLLEKHRDVADALVIDLRGNGGGYITLAEGLTQLFTPNRIKPMPVRFLPNKYNLSVFLSSNAGQENGWSQSVRNAMNAKEKYTKPLVITSHEQANRIGQVWFKPVVILTDANCYSACDLFAAAMQDHGAAIIIGTHASTGAGGANVMEYGVFHDILKAGGFAADKNPFVTLPGSQDMRVSWRQSIRVGKNKDALIEDAGVKSDVIVRSMTEDVVSGESRTLMRELQKAINKLLPRYQSSIKLNSSLMMANDAQASWNETVKGVDTLEVWSEKGKLVATYPVAPGTTKATQYQPVSITLPDFKKTWDEEAFHLIGKLSGAVQFRVVREVRWRGGLIQGGALARETFAKDKLDYFHMNQSSGAKGEGWQVRNGALVVGKGNRYTGNVSTQVFATFDTKGAKALALDLALTMDSEEDNDYLSVLVRNPITGDEQYLVSLSGARSLNLKNPVKIPTNGAEALEVVLEFTSDENWHLKGPSVRRLTAKSF